jgi:hypothetical protein
MVAKRQTRSSVAPWINDPDCSHILSVSCRKIGLAVNAVRDPAIPPKLYPCARALGIGERGPPHPAGPCPRTEANARSSRATSGPDGV